MTMISAIMSAYNSENFIKEAIDSILSQTFSDFEFIIINDASMDSTESIIKSYGDSRIKLINNQQNEGLAKSLNTGLDIANGKYIARMDADDVSLPERFQKQFDFMEQNQDIDICGTFYETFGNKSCVVRTPENDTDIKDALFFSNCIAHSSVMMRKSTIDKFGIKYDENLRSAQDYELWCREADRLKYANIPEILLKYRVHENQTGFAKKKEQDDAADNVRIRNLNKIVVLLTNSEHNIYLSVLKYRYDFNSTTDMISACEFFEKIRIAGFKHGYGSKFKEIISGHLSNIAQTGIRSGRTSLKLFFGIFLQNGVFVTNRAKMRYFYHSLRNIFNV
jgi:glycosyltransferase involved in cell wall biosynthesis